MPETRLDLKHVGILMRSHAKYAVRGGSGISFVLVVLVVGLVVAGVLVNPLDEVRKSFERSGGGHISSDEFMKRSIEQASPLIAWWLDAGPLGDPNPDRSPTESKDPPKVEYLLRDRPALLSVMFLILLALEPFMMAFGGFNQLSGDIANRGLRYLLLRTGRLNIVFSRFIGTFVFSVAISFFTMAVIVAYVALRFDLYSTASLIGWGLYGWAAVSIFSLPYLALCTWISTAIASPFGALALAQLGIGVPILVIKYAKTLMTDRNLDVGWLDRLTPWGWKFDLLHPEPAKVLLAVGAMLGFTGLMALLGTRHFLRRDL